MRWFARCVESLATLLLFSPLAASAQNVAVEIGANDFRISNMGPDGDADFDALPPAVAYNPNADEYLVVWYGDDDTDGEREVYGQRIDASTGAEVGENDFRISDMGTDGDERFYGIWPALASHPSASGQLVVWEGDDDIAPLVLGEFEIFGQMLFVPEPSRSLMLVSGVAFLALLRRARERTRRCCRRG